MSSVDDESLSEYFHKNKQLPPQATQKQVQLREKMMETLQTQLQQYQSQYAYMSQGPSFSQCD